MWKVPPKSNGFLAISASDVYKHDWAHCLVVRIDQTPNWVELLEQSLSFAPCGHERAKTTHGLWLFRKYPHQICIRRVETYLDSCVFWVGRVTIIRRSEQLRESLVRWNEEIGALHDCLAELRFGEVPIRWRQGEYLIGAFVNCSEGYERIQQTF
jgi:hypothetical protein